MKVGIRRYEDARDFAGADWQKLTERSRGELLKRAHVHPRWSRFSWWQLAPSVKNALIAPLMDEGRRAA